MMCAAFRAFFKDGLQRWRRVGKKNKAPNFKKRKAKLIPSEISAVH